MPRELEEQEAIGYRIRRKRLNLRMNQAALAAAVGKSQGWMSKVEKGHIELDSATVINGLARALLCHPNELIERPYTGTAAENRWREAAADILRELRRYDLSPAFTGAPRSASELWESMKRLHRLRDTAANSAIMLSLPDLLREVRALAEVSTGHEREEAFAIYAVCCKFAHTAAHALGHAELVAMACERAAWSAQLSGDPLMPAVVDWMRVWDMWATADWNDAISLSDKALRSIENDYERGDPLAIRAWGSLQLRAAVSAARAANAAEADHRLALADQASQRMVTSKSLAYDRHSLTFSSGNVQIHRVSVALEMSDQVKALTLNAHVDPAHLAALPNSRQGHHRMDLSRAYLWNGNRDKALNELQEAEKLAPQLVRNHPIGRATLRRIICAERASTRERLRAMSSRFNLDDQALFP